MPRPCPNDEELRAFHLGNLPTTERIALEDHLQQCPRCEATLERLDGPAVPGQHKTTGRGQLHVAGVSTMHWAGATERGVPETWPRLPGFEIVGILGHGGMGVVYKARQQKLNRLVALKQLSCGNPRAVSRARTEAEALAQLHHPNIVQIYEVVEHEGRAYLALELVEGGSLAERLTGKPQPGRDSAALIELLARAVDYAHARGIVHRDLKPANVLLAGSATGPSACSPFAGCMPKLTDFGIAKQLADDSGQTRDGDVIGTPAYMAPEQAAGRAGAIGPGSDVYSLGVLLYELLTGRVPLQGPTSLDTLQLARDEEPVPPRRLQPRIARDLETICLKCLQKDPSKRYAGAGLLADDLRRFLHHEPILARPTPTWERFAKWARRRPGVTALAAAVVLVAALGFVLVSWQWQRAEDKARDEADARLLAQDREQREKDARLRAENLMARVTLNEGTTLCEAGELDRGLLSISRALELAEGGDVDLSRAARRCLTVWQPFLPRERAELGHGDWVWAGTFSPDGRTLATASFDHTARLWDSATGKPRGKLLEHTGPVLCVAFSPDGKTLLTGGGARRGEGRLWDARDGRLLASWDHPSQVSAAVISPKGQTCLTVSLGQAVLREVSNGRPIGQPLRHPLPRQINPAVQPHMSAAFSPDGKWVVTAGEDGTARLWNAATGEPHGKPMQASGPIQAVAFSPDGSTVLTGSYNGTAQLWDVADGQPRGPALRHPGPVRAVAFSPDGRLAATAGAVLEMNLRTGKPRLVGGEVRLWEVESGRALGTPLVHPSPVWSVAFSPGGRLLLTGCEDSNARFFVVATGEQVGSALGHIGTVPSVAFSPDGTLAASAAAGGDPHASARLWEVPSEQGLPRLLLHKDTVTALAFSPDSQSLLSAGEEQSAQLWSLASGQPQGPPLWHDHPVHVAAFRPDGRSLFTSTYYQSPGNGKPAYHSDVSGWDLKTWRLRVELHHPAAILRAAFLPDGRTLLVGDDQGRIHTWDPATCKPLGEPLVQKGHVKAFSLASDGRTFLTSSDEGALLWDAHSRQRLQQWKEGGRWDDALLYPGGQQALVMEKGFAGHWSLTEGKRSAAPLFHAQGGIHRLALSPDGQTVLICDLDGTVRLWDVATGIRIGPPMGTAGIGPIDFSPDGRFLAVAEKYGKVAVWPHAQPLEGSPQRLRLWVEVLTGMELVAEGTIHRLSPEAVQQRRALLDQLGGPPTVSRSAPSRK